MATNTGIFGRIMAQVTSGRWLITIAATYCLIKLAHTLCALMMDGRVKLEEATYVSIVMSIINTIGLVTVFYFQKPRNAEDNGNGDTTDTTTTSTTSTTTLLDAPNNTTK